MPYRILFVSAAEEWGGGAEARLLGLTTELPRTGVETFLAAATANGVVDRFRARDVRTYALPPRHFIRRFPFVDYYWRGQRALRAIIREQGIDIVHTNDNRSVAPAERAARAARRAFVAHVVDMERPWLEPNTLASLRRADAVVAVSETVREYCVAGGVPAARVHVIYRGVDPEPFALGLASREALRDKLRVGEGEVLAGVFSRIDPRKGHAALIAALARPELAGVPLRVAVVGGAARAQRDFERTLRRQAADAGLRDRIVFLGHREDVPALMGACDFTIAPFQREAGGAAVLESLQAGRPVVAYASGFIPEIVRHEREGVLVPPGDVGALADALRRLATDAPLRARLAEGASLRAPEFTQERQLAALAALYARLAPSPRSG